MLVKPNEGGGKEEGHSTPLHCMSSLLGYLRTMEMIFSIAGDGKYSERSSLPQRASHEIYWKGGSCKQLPSY